MTNVISGGDDAPPRTTRAADGARIMELPSPTGGLSGGAAGLFLIFTARRGAAFRDADAGKLQSAWHTVDHSLTQHGLREPDGAGVKSRFDEFCLLAAAERLRARRLSLAMTSAALLVAVTSTLALAVFVLGSDRSQVLTAYAVTSVGLSLPIFWAVRRRSRSAVAAAALTTGTVGWWTTGAALPPQPQSMLDHMIGGGDEAAVGVALGAALTGFLLIVTAAFAAVEALARRNRHSLRRPDVNAFVELLQVIIPLATRGQHLDMPERLAMADHIAAAKRAVRRISVAARKHGDRGQRRDARRGLRRWKRHFSAETRALSLTVERENAALRACLQSMIPLLTSRYGELYEIGGAGERSVRDRYRSLSAWLPKLSGAAFPPAVLVAAHNAGVPATSVEGAAIAALAAGTLLLVVAASNGSDPFALLSSLLKIVRERTPKHKDHDRSGGGDPVSASNDDHPGAEHETCHRPAGDGRSRTHRRPPARPGIPGGGR